MCEEGDRWVGRESESERWRRREEEAAAVEDGRTKGNQEEILGGKRPENDTKETTRKKHKGKSGLCEDGS